MSHALTYLCHQDVVVKALEAVLPLGDLLLKLLDRLLGLLAFLSDLRAFLGFLAPTKGHGSLQKLSGCS